MAEQAAANTTEQSSNYIHGYHKPIVEGMAARTAEREGRFFLPFLKPGLRLLDLGCGPGSITLGFARTIAPGEVVGIDLEPEMVQIARRAASESGRANARFDVADAAELPFPDSSFDAAFGHTLLEHVPNPEKIVREVRRVLKPGGFFGARDGDLGGLVIYPSEPLLVESWEIYQRLWRLNGGNPDQGRLQRGLLRAAGLGNLQTTIGSIYFPASIGDVWAQMILAPRFADRVIALGWTDRARLEQCAAASRQWGQNPDAFQASIMVETVGWVAA